MKLQFYAFKAVFLSLLLFFGIGKTLKAQSIIAMMENYTAGNNGTEAEAGQIMIYTSYIMCGPQEVVIAAQFSNAIPIGTVYLPGSTLLNGSLVPDVDGNMPFATPRAINSPGAPVGIIDRNTTTIVEFRVRVTANAGYLYSHSVLTGNNITGLSFTLNSEELFTNISEDWSCDRIYQVTAPSSRLSSGPWNQLKEVDMTTGGAGTMVYEGTTGPCVEADGTPLPAGTLFTDVAAIAYDGQRARFYFVNNSTTTAQNLCYVDIFSVATAVTYNQPLETTTGPGYNITRMTSGIDGNFYALTENNLDLIQFSIDASNNPVINRLGALINDASNGVFDVLTETDGDIICDGIGKLYFIPRSGNVYRIEPATRVATYLGTITGLPTTTSQVTHSAAIDNEGNIYIGGSYNRLYRVSLENFTVTQVGIGAWMSRDYASCALPVQPLGVAARKQTTLKAPDVRRLSNEIFVKVQPNPFQKELNLQVQINTAENVKVRLIDFYGRTVYTTTERMGAGTNSLRLPVPGNLTAGLYVLELWAGNKRLLQKKLLKQ